MDIRMYTYFGGYNRLVDESTKKAVSGLESDIDMGFVRNHQYTDAHRKKLDDFDTLAKQMVGQRFAFMSGDGSVLSGKVESFSWDKYKVTIEFQITLDNEPDADIEYSANIHSAFIVNGDKVIFGDEGCQLPFDREGVAPNTLGVIL